MNYYFIGIKGTGMSSLACMLKDLGNEVSGSDLSKHFFTEQGLIERNIPIYSFNPLNIKDNMNIIVGNAFLEDFPEVIAARSNKTCKVARYHEFVGEFIKPYKTIAIAGSHGKTTTTGIVSSMMQLKGNTGWLIGDGEGHIEKNTEYFCLEADEFRRHFIAYYPEYAIITNIDLDHVDYFKDINDVVDAYNEFANKAEKMVIACGDDPYTHYLDINKPIFYYGIDEDNDIIAKNIEYKKDGTSFEVFVEDNYYGFFDLPIYGKHMLLDALAVISVCYYERLDVKEVSKLLKTFHGAKRRFTEIVVDDTIIIDDYAHHPNEVKATIKSVRQKYPDKKLVTVFQPHTFSRTKEFANALASAMNLADYSYVLEIHPAREKQEDFEGVTSKLIIDQLDHGEAITMNDSSTLAQYKGSVILFMSPNDLSTLENETIEKIKNSK